MGDFEIKGNIMTVPYKEYGKDKAFLISKCHKLPILEAGVFFLDSRGNHPIGKTWYCPFSGDYEDKKFCLKPVPRYENNPANVFIKKGAVKGFNQDLWNAMQANPVLLDKLSFVCKRNAQGLLVAWDGKKEILPIGSKTDNWVDSKEDFL